MEEPPAIKPASKLVTSIKIDTSANGVGNDTDDATAASPTADMPPVSTSSVSSDEASSSSASEASEKSGPPANSLPKAGSGSKAATSSVSAGLTAAKLRINPNLETTTVKRLLTRVPVQKTFKNQNFVRVHPDPAFRDEGVGIIELERDRRFYAVDPELSEVLKAYYKRHYVFTATTIGRAPFLWIIPMPEEDGSWNNWNRTKYDCALVAMDRWIQVHNGGDGWIPVVLNEPKPDPDWPEWLNPCVNLDQIIDLGFKSTYINKLDHPAVEILLRGK
jgi:hypothetical protein